MAVDPGSLSREELRNLIDNHRRRKATDSRLYLDALQELERREGKGLDFETSFRLIKAAAGERRFISYKELADASGANWNQVHYAIGEHLWRLVEYAHRKGWPMLSAVVVNKDNVATGAMEPATLKGFIAAARALGLPVVDEEEFLRSQQCKVFAWAVEEGGSAPPAVAPVPSMPEARMVRTNGIRLSVHEAGSGPAVVLLHGFPGLAHTWRHQIPALAAAGYRVVVPDLRGYGRSDAPAAVEAYDIQHLAADLTGLLDALGIGKAVFMGHDWGGQLAWQMPLLHPQRVAGVIGVNTPFLPHWTLWLHPDLVGAALPEGGGFVADPRVDPIVQMRRVYTPGMYVLSFQDGRRADEAMNLDPRATLRRVYRKGLMPASVWDKLPPQVTNMEYFDGPPSEQLPGHDVLTAQELDVYAAEFRRNGFTPAINWYRNISRNWKAGLDLDQTIRVPSMMVSAEHDVVLRPSMADGMHTHVPDLEKHVIADCWHWTPEEKPAELNRLALSWLQRRVPG